MDAVEDMHEFSNRMFIDYCKVKFGWRDLSRDVIMDVGCGEEGYCGKAILEKFPDVGAIIGADARLSVARNFRLRSPLKKVECVIANIENRETLRNYEGKMTKVVSTYVFQQLTDKEVAFRNVFHLLKPGGEAAVLFVRKSSIYEWLMELLKNPKWKEAYQGQHNKDMYDGRFGLIQYREMVQRIGFRIVEGGEEERVIPYQTDEICKEALYNMCNEKFKISPEQVQEFREECFQVLLKLSPRDSEGRPCYRSIELYLLLLKPSDDSGPVTRKKKTLDLKQSS